MANHKAASMLGYTQKELLGLSYRDISDELDQSSKLLGTLLAGEPVPLYERRFRRRDGHRIPVEINVELIRDDSGKPLYILSVVRDITQRKEAEERIRMLLAEKELLLREVHHRVKNNLHQAMALLTWQAEGASGQEAREAIISARDRLRSMGVLYEKLYKSEGTGTMPIRSYLEPLIDLIISSVPVRCELSVSTRFDDVVLPASQLSSLGMLVNEVITNALKYAFEGREKGTLRVEVVHNVGVPGGAASLLLTVSDDGVGMAAPHSAGGFGLTLVSMLAEQLGGTWTMASDGGTTVRVVFPLSSSAGHLPV